MAYETISELMGRPIILIRFCIDLKKINNLTIKDTYSISQVQKTLDFLNGAVSLTCLDLKSGYWQVEMTKASKALTTFTVGPLGIYIFERVPF